MFVGCCMCWHDMLDLFVGRYWKLSHHVLSFFLVGCGWFSIRWLAVEELADWLLDVGRLASQWLVLDSCLLHIFWISINVSFLNFHKREAIDSCLLNDCWMVFGLLQVDDCSDGFDCWLLHSKPWQWLVVICYLRCGKKSNVKQICIEPSKDVVSICWYLLDMHLQVIIYKYSYICTCGYVCTCIWIYESGESAWAASGDPSSAKAAQPVAAVTTQVSYCRVQFTTVTWRLVDISGYEWTPIPKQT